MNRVRRVRAASKPVQITVSVVPHSGSNPLSADDTLSFVAEALRYYHGACGGRWCDVHIAEIKTVVAGATTGAPDNG